MAFEDIGYTLFVEILGMTQYPGQPFTGVIVRDLIMFLLIPSIFIILVLYMTVGRVVAVANAKVRLLVGVGAYLFIIAGGYYRAFALLAGPYFVFLIFLMGILFFFLEHFRKGGGGGGSKKEGGTYPMGNILDKVTGKNTEDIEDDLADINRTIEKTESSANAGGIKESKQLYDLYKKKRELEKRLGIHRRH